VEQRRPDLSNIRDDRGLTYGVREEVDDATCRASGEIGTMRSKKKSAQEICSWGVIADLSVVPTKAALSVAHYRI
jgi:hypothetical protein